MRRLHAPTRLARTTLTGVLWLAALCVPRLAAADDVSARLASYEAETRDLGVALPPPNQTGNTATGHRLVDAEVSYSLGDYDAAALVLFDYVGHPGPDQETATFYLAESLYEKGDRGAAHGYYAQLVASGNVSSHYYQPALERLVELAIATHDPADAQQWLGDMDRLSPGLRLPSIPYVRGKFAFAQGNYDEALAYFQDVPKGTDYELQALYYTGTTLVAKKDLPRATEVFTDLIARPPRSSNDRRVVELGQMALGRLFYERDEPTKSIDSYLLVDRRSDLFPDALYEVSWVYVKNKQYDKALRALELLAQSEPQSEKTPTVRILEGNLRIRKAQMIRAAQVDGTANAADDPQIEYDKANEVFTSTHDQYAPAYTAVSGMIDAKVDPTLYLAQLAGRSGHVFAATAPLPEAAAQMLRDEPEVQRVVSVETDLDGVSTDVAEIEATIARLEGVLAANDKSNVYPSLAGRRARIAGIQNELLKLRDDLADRQAQLVNPSGELAQLTATRKQLSEQYRAMPNAAAAASDALTAAQQGYDAIDDAANDVQAGIDGAQAIAVALRTYLADPKNVGPSAAVTDTVRTSTLAQLDAATTEAAAIDDELAATRREVQLGRDLASAGDAGLTAARTLRKQVTAAQSAEERVLAGFASASHDPEKAAALATLGDRATRIADELDQIDGQIEMMVGQGLAQARTLLDGYRYELGQIQHDLADNEADARGTGGAAIAASLADVKAKLYDIVVRTDVGSVDVAWSQKEDNDDDLKRLNLARSRELKQLRDEFHDILDENVPKPSEPKKPLDLPQPDSNGVVSPTGGDKPGTQTSSVKPDANAPDPKAPAPHTPATPKKGPK
jgi:tetratricopeptide (TPR) repeat protein